ncbi:MAG TPA: 3-methyl-2-oxobutanoate hydroxymethyltransferase [Ignisphaera aggregans]|uniref:3-methyl-2-oxobutanoate hydroxymethyltransferase n=1 Tax=Ignisphaera aggregans TaxID=334771 RepID=A0A832YY20_9CREN|nr:3-methyl-2-oxobutanoate hydroxymethyltransferase [Ignisphaera aggregans]
MRSKVTVRDFLKKKQCGERIVMVTAYDYVMARLVDMAGVDGILVGDSVAMTMLGLDSTVRIGMRTILHHLSAVSRAKPRALVVADMPFGSYEINPEDALRNAIKLVRHGAEAVKLEGGIEIFNVVERLVKAGIPVMGHIGLNPQRALVLGGYRLMGKDVDQAIKIVEDAKALEEAGVFAIVIEHTAAEVAAEVTKRVKVPTICIGSGPYCDGQILVLHDILGLSENPPYFAKVYRDLSKEIIDAVREFINEVRSGQFPSKQHYKSMRSEEYAKFIEKLSQSQS